MFIGFHFAKAWVLWFLMVMPLIWYVNSKLDKKRKLSAKLQEFADSHLLPELLNDIKVDNSNFNFLFYMAIIFAILALAQPRWGFDEQVVYKSQASVILLLDLSYSMNADDVKPSRIARARYLINDLLEKHRHLNVGAVGFAGNPHLVTPITDDFSALHEFLPYIEPTIITKQGDELDPAIDLSIDMFASDVSHKKLIVLFTDGGFRFSKSKVKQLLQKDIILHVVAIGTKKGSPFKDKNGNFVKENQQIQVSYLDETNINTLLKLSKGKYIDYKNNKLLHDILNNTNSSTSIEGDSIRQWHDRYYVFLVPVMVSMMVMLWRNVIFVILFTITLYAQPSYALFKNSDQLALESFNLENYEDSIKKFSNPYNKGVSAYKNKDYQLAENFFAEAVENNQSFNSLYNLANSQMFLQKYTSAIEYYEKSLDLEPNNQSAQHNLEIAKKLLEQQEPNQQQSNDEQENSEQQDIEQQEQDSSDEYSDKSENTESQQDNADKAPDKVDWDDNMADKWLNHLESNLGVFLQRKFYIEDLIADKKIKVDK